MAGFQTKHDLLHALRANGTAGRVEDRGDILAHVVTQRDFINGAIMHRIVAQPGANGGLEDGDGNAYLRYGANVLAPDGDGSELTGITWSQLGSTPTTLSGYGITEAVANPVIETITRWTTLELNQPYDVIPLDASRIAVVNASLRYVRIIDTATMTVAASADLGSGKTGWNGVLGGGSLWVTNSANNLYEINPTDGSVLNTYTLPTDGDSAGIATRDIVYHDGFLYVVNHNGGSVAKIDAADGSVDATITVGSVPYGLVINAGKLYVSNYSGGTISVIDLATDTVTATWTPASIQSPRGLACDGKTLWIANSALPSTYLVIGVDLASGETVYRVAVPEGDQAYGVYFDGANIRFVSYEYNGGDSTNSCRLYTATLEGKIIAARNVGFAHQREMAALNGVLYVAMAGNQSELVVATPASLNAIYELQADRAGWPGGVIREQFDKLRYVREVDLSRPACALSSTDATYGLASIDGLILSANSESWVTNNLSTYGIQIQVNDTTGRACGFSTGRKNSLSGCFASNEDFIVVAKIEARTHSNLVGNRHYFGSGIYTSGSSSALADPAVSTDPRLSVSDDSNYVQINVGAGWVATPVNVNGKTWLWSIERFRGDLITRLSLDGINWVTVNTQTGITTGGGRIFGAYNVCEDDATFPGANTNNNIYVRRFWIGRDPRN